MARVLIPFSEPDGALRAVAQLLAEVPDPRLRVHLVAIVEVRRPGKVRMFVDAATAQAQAQAAGKRWLALLAGVLDAARVPCTAEVIMGSPRTALRATLARTDVDRVLLPPPRMRLFSWGERARLAQRCPHPVTLVA
jgi:hypothetical protein